MTTEPSKPERVAFEIVRRVLGTEVTHHDTGAHDRQGAVDAVIDHPDGRRAALEVTVLTDPAGAEVESILAGDDFKWTYPDLRWWWTVTIPPGADIRGIRAGLHDVLRWCETYQVTNPDVRSWIRSYPGSDEVTRFMDTSGVDGVHGHPDVLTHAGDVMVTPAGKGGAAMGDMSLVSSWLTAEAASARTARKIDKLVASGKHERHLFLIVDDSGAPFAGFYAMAFGDGVPPGDPHVPEVSHVWVAPRWSPTVLLWDVENGWSRHQPYDDRDLHIELEGPSQDE